MKYEEDLWEPNTDFSATFQQEFVNFDSFIGTFVNFKFFDIIIIDSEQFELSLD